MFRLNVFVIFSCHLLSVLFNILILIVNEVSTLFNSMPQGCGFSFFLYTPLMWWLVVPQVASGRQCPQHWSMSLALIRSAWQCPMSPAVANHMSCSRSMASTGTPSPSPSARCSAAPPTPSKCLPAPPTYLITPLEMKINSQICFIHMTPSSSLWIPLSK